MRSEGNRTKPGTWEPCCGDADDFGSRISAENRTTSGVAHLLNLF